MDTKKKPRTKMGGGSFVYDNFNVSRKIMENKDKREDNI